MTFSLGMMQTTANEGEAWEEGLCVCACACVFVCMCVGISGVDI